MKKAVKICLACAAIMMLLTSCTPKSDPLGENVLSAGAVQPQNLYEEPLAADEGEIQYNFDEGEYNPASEEEAYDPNLPVAEPAGFVVSQPQNVTSEYAGATPIIIDPVDKPTPTPVPPLSFTYQQYYASSLGVSFEGPAGWNIDDSVSGVYVLTNPVGGMDYQARAEIKAERVSTDYTAADLKAVVKTALDSVKDSGVKSFSPSQTAERNMMEKTGVYANYTAVSPEGAAIAGRIHVVEVNRTLYTVHVSYPKAYTTTYVDGVYTKIRKTLKTGQ